MFIGKKLSNSSPTWLCPFAFLPALYLSTSPCSSTYFPTFFYHSFISAILIDMKQNLTVVFICIFLITNHVECLFHVLFCHLCILSGEVCIQVFCPPSVGLFVFLLLRYRISLFCISVLYHIMIQKYFLPICGLSFHFLNGVFEGQTFVILIV